MVFRGVPGINNVTIGAVRALCENAPEAMYFAVHAWYSDSTGTLLSLLMARDCSIYFTMGACLLTASLLFIVDTVWSMEACPACTRQEPRAEVQGWSGFVVGIPQICF